MIILTKCYKISVFVFQTLQKVKCEPSELNNAKAFVFSVCYNFEHFLLFITFVCIVSDAYFGFLHRAREYLFFGSVCTLFVRI